MKEDVEEDDEGEVRRRGWSWKKGLGMMQKMQRHIVKAGKREAKRMRLILIIKDYTG